MITLNEALKRLDSAIAKGATLNYKSELPYGWNVRLNIANTDDEFIWIVYDKTINGYVSFQRYYYDGKIDCTLGRSNFYHLTDKNKREIDLVIAAL